MELKDRIEKLEEEVGEINKFLEKILNIQRITDRINHISLDFQDKSNEMKVLGKELSVMYEELKIVLNKKKTKGC